MSSSNTNSTINSSPKVPPDLAPGATQLAPAGSHLAPAASHLAPAGSHQAPPASHLAPGATQPEQNKSNQQTFTWSTPFFDLQFVDIRTKKGSMGHKG